MLQTQPSAPPLSPTHTCTHVHTHTQLVVGGSNQKSKLVLSDLVQGTYNFTLTVTNNQNMAASDTATITVLPNPLDIYSLQVHLEGDATTFSVTQQVRHT